MILDSDACLVQEPGPAIGHHCSHAYQFMELRNDGMRVAKEDKRIFIKILMNNDHRQDWGTYTDALRRIKWPSLPYNYLPLGAKCGNYGGGIRKFYVGQGLVEYAFSFLLQSLDNEGT